MGVESCFRLGEGVTPPRGGAFEFILASSAATRVARLQERAGGEEGPACGAEGDPDWPISVILTQKFLPPPKAKAPAGDDLTALFSKNTSSKETLLLQQWETTTGTPSRKSGTRHMPQNRQPSRAPPRSTQLPEPAPQPLKRNSPVCAPLPPRRPRGCCLGLVGSVSRTLTRDSRAEYQGGPFDGWPTPDESRPRK